MFPHFHQELECVRVECGAEMLPQATKQVSNSDVLEVPEGGRPANGRTEEDILAPVVDDLDSPFLRVWWPFQRLPRRFDEAILPLPTLNSNVSG